jgi:hypothetical protein
MATSQFIRTHAALSVAAKSVVEWRCCHVVTLALSMSKPPPLADHHALHRVVPFFTPMTLSLMRMTEGMCTLLHFRSFCQISRDGPPHFAVLGLGGVTIPISSPLS